MKDDRADSPCRQLAGHYCSILIFFVEELRHCAFHSVPRLRAMPITLYDTLTRSPKLLAPATGKPFRFYCCGPTVYGPAHVGNFRTFLLQDVLHRALEVDGIELIHVRNITDVDDKTIRESRKEGESLQAFTEKWTQQFHADCAALNMRPPTLEPQATAHIGEQIDMIARLIDQGHAYVSTDGSVYFKVKSCQHYGQLSHLDPASLQTQSENSAGRANDADEYDRESVNDFALWKAHKPEDGPNSWDSPWGKGRPGWHIECSAMSTKYLGESFDLHGGGVDLCFPHHENEIAQSECATGIRPFAKHWFHCAHLMVNNAKMSKSLGNFYTLADIRDKGYAPMVLRYALISGHYRQSLNLTENSLNSAQSALNKLEKTVAKLLPRAHLSPEEFLARIQPNALATTGIFAGAWNALADDLNIPACLGELFTALKNLDDPDFDTTAVRGQLEALGSLLYALGLSLFYADSTASRPIPDEIQELAQQRWQAKSNKDWSTADRLRDEMSKKGWRILDRKDGYDIERADAEKG